MKAPNEKLIETLFTYHALRYLEGCGASVYTPSTREEYELGYDAKLMGAGGFDELYLQFKAPSLLKGDGYSFRTYEHQHDRLQDYPSDTAYYLTHLFRGVEQVQRAQREATNPLDFLRWYVAIEVHRLERVQLFWYAGDTESRRAYGVLYKLRDDRPREHPKRPLDSGGWMTGAELLLRFEQNAIGARMILAGGDDEAQTPAALVQGEKVLDRVCLMSPERARQMIRGDEGRDMGTALRKNAEPLPPDTDR
jgi:hypothetical protein